MKVYLMALRRLLFFLGGDGIGGHLRMLIRASTLMKGVRRAPFTFGRDGMLEDVAKDGAEGRYCEGVPNSSVQRCGAERFEEPLLV